MEGRPQAVFKAEERGQGKFLWGSRNTSTSTDLSQGPLLRTQSCQDGSVSPASYTQSSEDSSPSTPFSVHIPDYPFHTLHTALQGNTIL